MIDSVVDITSAAPSPITARNAISAGGGDEHGQRGCPAEDDDSDQQDALAPVAITEGASRQQQAGEDQRVRVDDPLQLRLRRARRAR